MMSMNKRVLAGLALASVLLASGPALAAGAAKAKLDNPAKFNEKAPDFFQAQFTTSKGVFVVAVTRAWAPLGADRFYNLVKNGFYNGCRFFRVLTGFVAQFGINGDPKIAAAWENANIFDDPVKQSNLRGTVTFATGGPNTRTTQLFINYADKNARLDGMGFAPFGKVSRGMEVVDALYSGYGEGVPHGSGPDQELIGKKGNDYLNKSFPYLDFIKSAVILPIKKH
jgi:peptidyl-prolyl cis-trans isomerase A (cyclophilin A)